jgi:hypothetical protein
MADGKAALRIHRHAVRPHAARQLDEYADASEVAVGQQRHPPHRVVAGHGEVKDVLIRGQHQPVRARNIAQQQFEMTVGAQSIEPPCRVVQSALTLISKVEVAVLCKDQVIEPLEALTVRPVEIRLELPRMRIEQQ